MKSKIVAIAAMASVLWVAVPPAFAHQQKTGPAILPVPPSGPGSKLDPTYRAVNVAALGIWTTLNGAKPNLATQFATMQTSATTSNAHAQANGNNATANAQKTYVNNLESELANPSPTLVAGIQSSMKAYNGMVVSTAAVTAFCQKEATRMSPLIALFNSGGMEAVENYGVQQLETVVAQAKAAQSGRMVYANYHPSLGGFFKLDAPSALQVFVDTELFIAAVLAAMSALGCEECDGGAAAAALLAATAQLGGDLLDGISALGAQTGPWVDDGTVD